MLKDSFLLSANRLAKSVTQIFITILLARILSVEEMGIFQQIFLIAIMVGSFIPFEMQTTLSYFYSKTEDKEERSRIISNTFFVLILLGVITFIVLNSIFGVFLQGSLLKEYTIWMGLWCFATIIGSYLENLFVSTRHAKVFSIITLVYYAGYFLTVLLIIFNTSNLLLIVQVIGILEFIRVLILHIVFHTKQRISFKVDFSLLQKQVKYTLAVGAVTAIEVVNNSTDKVMVSIYYSVKEFAVFSIAAKEIPFMAIITVAVITAMLPRLGNLYNVQKDPKATLELWSNTSRVLAVIIFPIFWILLFYHKAFIELLYSEVYLSGAVIFVIYLLKFPLRFTVFYTLLLISGKQKLILINSIITVLLNIVLSFLFLSLFGYLGVAAATVLAAYVGAYLQQRDVCKVFQTKQSELLPYKKVFITFFLSGLSTGLIYLVFSFLKIHQFAQFFVGGALSMAVCLFIAFIRNEISPNVIPKNKLFMKVVRDRNI